MDVDILTLDLGLKCVSTVPQAYLKAATSRGVHLEVENVLMAASIKSFVLKMCYDPSLFGNAKERQRFCTFLNYHVATTRAKV